MIVMCDCLKRKICVESINYLRNSGDSNRLSLAHLLVGSDAGFGKDSYQLIGNATACVRMLREEQKTKVWTKPSHLDANDELDASGDIDMISAFAQKISQNKAGGCCDSDYIAADLHNITASPQDLQSETYKSLAKQHHAIITGTVSDTDINHTRAVC